MKYIPVSKDEPFMMKEDSYLGDMLTTCVDPESLWMMLEGSTFNPHTLPADDGGLPIIHSYDFPYSPLGVGIQIPGAREGIMVYENGVVVSHTGKVLTPRRRAKEDVYGPIVSRDGSTSAQQWTISYPTSSGKIADYRVAHLVLDIHGDMPMLDGSTNILFIDGDIDNCTVNNLRWVS